MPPLFILHLISSNHLGVLFALEKLGRLLGFRNSMSALGACKAHSIGGWQLNVSSITSATERSERVKMYKKNQKRRKDVPQKRRSEVSDVLF